MAWGPTATDFCKNGAWGDSTTIPFDTTLEFKTAKALFLDALSFIEYSWVWIIEKGKGERGRK